MLMSLLFILFSDLFVAVFAPHLFCIDTKKKVAEIRNRTIFYSFSINPFKARITSIDEYLDKEMKLPKMLYK